jgi:hypothetical protein
MTTNWHGFTPGQRVYCPATKQAGTVAKAATIRAIMAVPVGVPVEFDGAGGIQDVPPEHLSLSAPITVELTFRDPLKPGKDVTVDLCQLIPLGRDIDLNDFGTRMNVREAVTAWVDELDEED